MSDSEVPELPDRWQAIKADTIYCSSEGRLISFSQTQIQLLTQTLAQIDPDQIANQHLQDCQAEIHGYWDETDQPYETIRFKQCPTPQLISSSLGVTPTQAGNTHWLQLKYSLTISPSISVGELLLILNDSLEVIDENWLIDVRSPYVIATVDQEIMGQSQNE